MTHKKLNYGSSARAKMLVGAEVASRFVGATLGPKGRTVCIENEVLPPSGMNAPPVRYIHTTKDGVTVARALSLVDKEENLGLELVREAATQTVRMAGDGTTTATILAHAIFAGGLKALDAGANPVHIKSGIEKAVHSILKNLDAMSMPCTPSMKTQIARISANGDDSVAGYVLEAMEAAGPDGVISLDYSRTIDTYVEVSRGMKIDSGMVAENFVTNPEKGECVLTDAVVLLFQRSIKSINPIIPLLDWVAKNNKSLLILSESFEVELLQMLISNKMNGMLRSCCVRLPFHGDLAKEVLSDYAALLGGRAFTDETSVKLDSIVPEQLGSSARVIVTKSSCTVTEGGGTAKDVEDRASLLRVAMKESVSDYRKEILSQRLARLVGGIAVIKVGAPTPTEMQEKKDRVEDAMYAVRAAVEHGVVSGGGAALYHASRDVVGSVDNEDERKGAGVVFEACKEPARRIAANGGYDPAVVLAGMESGRCGFDALTGEYGDLVGRGVIDPLKVVKTALSNAASVAATMLTAEGTIVNEEDAHVQAG
jgi:chaperonin GroEL